LVYAFNWKKLSISAALGYRWDGKRCRLWFQTRPGSYNDERLIAFLRDLKKHLRGQKAILGWIACAQESEDEAVSGEPA
jgi:hypothetical protein